MAAAGLRETRQETLQMMLRFKHARASIIVLKLECMAQNRKHWLSTAHPRTI